MGWWQTNEDGVSFAVGQDDLYWGDGPADIIDNAIEEINEEFRKSMGRDVTKAELIAGMKFSASIKD